MNNTVLLGRLTTDPELRTTGTGKSVCNVNIAVDRFAIEEDKQSVDFIPIQVWGKLAENLCKYQSKGSQIALEGTLRIDNYKDKDGNTKSKMYVLANRIEFLSTKKKEDATDEIDNKTSLKQDEIVLTDEELPF